MSGEPPQPAFVASVDPGMIHCASVVYDVGADRFVSAQLENLLCSCNVPGMASGARVTIFDLRDVMPHRFADLDSLIAAHEAPQVRVAVERQNARSTANILVQEHLQDRYPGQAALCPPTVTKRLWNAAAEAAGQLPCFRQRGSHSVNKTDARRLLGRVLTQREQALFRDAAQRHATHYGTCPGMVRHEREKLRKRARMRRKRAVGDGVAVLTDSPLPHPRPRPTISKTDDLLDAALQAVAASPTGLERATARLRRGCLPFAPFPSPTIDTAAAAAPARKRARPSKKPTSSRQRKGEEKKSKPPRKRNRPRRAIAMTQHIPAANPVGDPEPDPEAETDRDTDDVLLDILGTDGIE